MQGATALSATTPGADSPCSPRVGDPQPVPRRGGALPYPLLLLKYLPGLGGALATQWLPHARRSGPAAVEVAAGVGITNALAEETLWRARPARSGWTIQPPTTPAGL